MSFKDNLLIFGAGYLLLLFLFCKIVIVNPKAIRILSFNPFVKKINVEVPNITYMLIKTNTFAGMTTIRIQSKERSIERTAYLLKWEQNKLAKLLESYGINIESYSV